MPTDRGPGEPSTSGEEAEKELTSEEEIIRLLNCPDHYSVWGLPPRGAIDATWLKREYRKKVVVEPSFINLMFKRFYWLFLLHHALKRGMLLFLSSSYCP